MQGPDGSERYDDKDVSQATFQHGDQCMPSKSQKQNRFMHAVAENTKLGKRLGVPQRVAKDFLKADKGRKIKKLPVRVAKMKKR